MRVSAPSPQIIRHTRGPKASLAIPASGALRVESESRRRVSVLIDNFYGELENMRFVIVILELLGIDCDCRTCKKARVRYNWRGEQ